MTAGPGDHAAAAEGRGDGHFLASHADREQAIEVLKDAFAQGRLAEDELDSRTGQALASRTCAELAAVTADIPVGPAAAPAAAPPPRRPLIAANSWVERRSRGQLPPRPAQGSQAPEVQPPGRAGQDPALPLGGSLDGPPDGDPDRPDQARADLRPDSSPPGWPHSPGRGARTPRGIRPVPGAV